METDELNLVIGNSVESLMFAITNNYYFIENKKKFYLWFDSIATPFDLNGLYQSLYMFWVANDKVLLSAEMKKIYIEKNKGVRVSTFDNKETISFGFDHVFLFDDENILDIPNKIISTERIYRVCYPWASGQTLFLEDPLMITTGKKFPSSLYISARKQKDMKFSKEYFDLFPETHFLYFANSAVSFLTKKELESSEYSERFLRFFFQDFMKYYSCSTMTLRLSDKILNNIILNYEDDEYVTPLYDKNILKDIYDTFWEKMFTFSKNQNENISNFRACFDFAQFLKMSFEANNLGSAKTLSQIKKEDENARKIEDQMSKIIAECNSPRKGSFD